MKLALCKNVSFPNIFPEKSHSSKNLNFFSRFLPKLQAFACSFEKSVFTGKAPSPDTIQKKERKKNCEGNSS